MKINKNNELLSFVDRIAGDPNYQTIEIGGKRIRSGYSRSWKSWENILSLGVSFKDKKVCDLGCYIGYFCFRMEEQGAGKLLGLDKNPPALEIAKTIANYTSSTCNFEERDIGKEGVGEGVDIILALNMLHHVRKNMGNAAHIFAIKDMFKNCSEAIFEVNEDELSAISKESECCSFKLIKKISSHRKTQYGNRFILYYKRMKNEK